MIDTSIIIPTFNKKTDIELTLSAFNQQTYPRHRFEVLVVDDGSTDGTESLVKSFSASYSLVYHSQENAGRSAARNAGIQRAQGRTLIFCDAEAIPDIQFVEQHAKHHVSADDKVVVGSKFDLLARWDTDIPKGYLNDLEQTSGHLKCVRDGIAAAKQNGGATFLTRGDIDKDFECLRKWVFRRAPHNCDRVIEKFTHSLEGFAVPWVLFVTVNVSLTKKMLETVGPFDEQFSGWGIEDTELGYRLFKKGADFIYEEQAANYHQMHSVNRDGHRRDLARNFGLFCEKHPAYEVFLLWRHARSRLDSCTYSDLVNEYYRLSTVANSSPLLKDYLDHCRKTARDFIIDAEFTQFTP